MKAVEYTDEIIRLSAAKRHRNAILLKGSLSWQQDTIAQIFSRKKLTVASNRDWSREGFSSDSISFAQCERILGSEVDHVLFDAFDGYNANAMGIISGCVRAGGLFIIVPPTTDAILNNGFSRYCNRILQNFQSIYRIFEEEEIDPPVHSKIDQNQFLENEDIFQDQHQAVEAICHVVTGQRKRPTVLVALKKGRRKFSFRGAVDAPQKMSSHIAKAGGWFGCPSKHFSLKQFPATCF